ncbi:MAG: hypothetical protein ABR552_07620 [Actinomycetota bacterium]
MSARTGFVPFIVTLFYFVAFPYSALFVAPIALWWLARRAARAGAIGSLMITALALPHAVVLAWGLAGLVPQHEHAVQLPAAVVAIFATAVAFALRAPSATAARVS